MAYLRSDFLRMLVDEVRTRPAAAAALRAGDPRMLVLPSSFAAMLSALSTQMDASVAEPFLKARAGTVLADAALKGILPLASPARVQVSVRNQSASAITMGVGRFLVDGKGRRYVVDGAATIAAGATGLVTATQQSTRTESHTVSGTRPFYEVLIPASDEDVHIVGIDIADGVAAYRYAEEFCNILVGERIFHVETDEYRRLWVRFGAADASGDVYGHQPADGDVITITLRECAGEVELSTGATFAIETITSAAEAEAELTLDEMLSNGADPPTYETMRMLARYPGLHDSNAVFLADFDFLLRRKVAGLEFLSVWNERIEEGARGASVDNVNTLFVSFSSPTVATATMQTKITQVIAKADDSYRVRFVALREVVVPMVIRATVAAVHDGAAVESQIRTVLLNLYGRGSSAASLGLTRTFRLQDVIARLKAEVPALQDQISDFDVTVGATASPLPEDFRYVTMASLSINVALVTDSMGLYGN